MSEEYVKKIIEKYSLEERKLRERFNRELFQLNKRRNEELQKIKNEFEKENHLDKVEDKNPIPLVIIKPPKQQLECFPLEPIPEHRKKEDEYKSKLSVPRPLPIPRVAGGVDKARKLNEIGNQMNKNKAQLVKKLNLIIKKKK